MPRRKTSLNVVRLVLKVPQSMMDDADKAIQSSPDFELSNITRTDILRVAMRKGLDAILGQQRLSPTATTARTVKPAKR
jgi:hypothetical protein